MHGKTCAIFDHKEQNRSSWLYCVRFTFYPYPVKSHVECGVSTPVAWPVETGHPKRKLGTGKLGLFTSNVSIGEPGSKILGVAGGVREGSIYQRLLQTWQ